MSQEKVPRRTFMNVMGLGTVAMAMPKQAKASESTSQSRPPNIVLIVSDDQGYNDLGCYGSEEIKTPNLDRLAFEGARLTSFYVTWPACTPSRGSLLTGRYPQRNGTYDMFRNYLVDVDHLYKKDEYAVSPERILGMDTREVLLPRVLKQAGYTSGIFGKWDLGQLHRFLPLQRGFDEFYGFVNTGIDYWTHERYGVPSMYRNNCPTVEDKGTYCTKLFKQEALRFINENKDRPFFCYVPFNAPHGASNLDRPRPGVQAPLEYIREHYGEYDPDESNTQRSRRMRFMAATTYMDEAIGEILDTLDQNNLTDNTIVIFFSDNGGGGSADNTPLRGGKGRMFEGGLRVPCIVRWPGVVTPGTVCDEFLTSMEIFPMLCNATMEEKDSPKLSREGKFLSEFSQKCQASTGLLQDVILDGFDMRPVLTGEMKSPRKEMFWQRRSDKGARVGQWKWVDSKRGTGLFNLANDLEEKHDLSKEKPEVLQMVKDRFENWKKEMEAAEPRRPFRDF